MRSPTGIFVAAALAAYMNREIQRQKSQAAKPCPPEMINWVLLLSKEIQRQLPDDKLEAIRIYQRRTGSSLGTAKTAINHAVHDPDRVAAEAARQMSEQSANTEPETATYVVRLNKKRSTNEIDWMLLLSKEIQRQLPDDKPEAIRVYQQRSGSILGTAKTAIDYAVNQPEYVAEQAALQQAARSEQRG